jgi:hypothetical protein
VTGVTFYRPEYILHWQEASQRAVAAADRVGFLCVIKGLTEETRVCGSPLEDITALECVALVIEDWCIVP